MPTVSLSLPIVLHWALSFSGDYYWRTFTYPLFSGANSLGAPASNTHSPEPKTESVKKRASRKKGRAQLDTQLLLRSKHRITCHAFRYMPVKATATAILGMETGAILATELRGQVREERTFNSNPKQQYMGERINVVVWPSASPSTFLAATARGQVYFIDVSREEPSPEEIAVLEEWNEATPYRRRMTAPKPGFRSVRREDATSNPVEVWDVCHYDIYCIEVSPDGCFVALGGQDGVVRVVNKSERRLVRAWKSYNGAVLGVAWSPDGRLVASGGEDDMVSVWDVESGILLWRGLGHKSWVRSLSFDPVTSSPEEDYYLLASGGDDGCIAFWVVQPHFLLDRLLKHARDIDESTDGECEVGLESPLYADTVRFWPKVALDPPEFPALWNRTKPLDMDELPDAGWVSGLLKREGMTRSSSSFGLYIAKDTHASIHPATSRDYTAQAAPISCRAVHSQGVQNLFLAQEGLLSCDRSGTVKLWARPGYIRDRAGIFDTPLKHDTQQLSPTDDAAASARAGGHLSEVGDTDCISARSAELPGEGWDTGEREFSVSPRSDRPHIASPPRIGNGVVTGCKPNPSDPLGRRESSFAKARPSPGDPLDRRESSVVGTTVIGS